MHLPSILYASEYVCGFRDGEYRLTDGDGYFRYMASQTENQTIITLLNISHQQTAGVYIAYNQKHK